MKGEVKLPALILVGVLVLGLIIFGISKVMKTGDLDQGTVKYTPGVPPWMEKDPNKKGAGGVPGASPPGPGTTGAPPPPGGSPP